MALKYGSKSGGFGLRSGNKSSLPFKQMGSSSPTKEIGLGYEFGSKADLSGSKKDTTLSTDPSKEIRGLDVRGKDTGKYMKAYNEAKKREAELAKKNQT